MKFFQNKNSLSVWAISLCASLSLIWYFEPTNFSTVFIEIAAIILGSFLCGFALAGKDHKTVRSRFFKAAFFAGSNLFLVSCIAFLGCFSPPVHHYTPEQLKEQRHQRLIANKARIEQEIQPRSPEADASMIDLTAFYDALLPVGTNRSMAPGIHKWNQTRFDVRGIVSANNSEDGKIQGIPVGQKCWGMDFLHGVYWDTKTKLVSTFVVHYANGQSATISNLFGVDMLRSWNPNNLLPANSITWKERTDTNGVVHPVFVFYSKEWNNPLPNETVESIDFVSDGIHSGAFLVAITLRKNSATKP
jgi:hypothetical protein